MNVEGAANGVRIEAFVDRSRITIGDRVTYTINADVPGAYRVAFPEVKDELGGFAVKDHGQEGPVKSGKETIGFKRWYVLETFTVGPYVIPSLALKIRGPAGQDQEIKTPQVFVEVASVLPKGQVLKDIRDIKQPVNLGGNYVLILIMLLVIVVVSGIVFYYYKRTQISETVKVPPKPAHVLALEELEKIQAMGLVEAGRIKEYYFLLSGCLRHYLENRYKLNAPEQTTEEFLEATLNQDAILREHRKILKSFMEESDMVKFARLLPEQEEISKTYGLVRDFIYQTKQNETIVKPVLGPSEIK